MTMLWKNLKLRNLLNDYLLKEYEKEGKMQLIVGIGCTGGQHRSVTLTNFLADHYKKYYKVYKWHRDADHQRM